MENQRFFSCILDDFQDYIYDGFASLLNKSRSANVGVIFSTRPLAILTRWATAFETWYSPHQSEDRYADE